MCVVYVCTVRVHVYAQVHMTTNMYAESRGGCGSALFYPSFQQPHSLGQSLSRNLKLGWQQVPTNLQSPSLQPLLSTRVQCHPASYLDAWAVNSNFHTCIAKCCHPLSHLPNPKETIFLEIISLLLRKIASAIQNTQ